jgi:hypothetical protein
MEKRNGSSLRGAVFFYDDRRWTADDRRLSSGVGRQPADSNRPPPVYVLRV